MWKINVIKIVLLFYNSKVKQWIRRSLTVAININKYYIFTIVKMNWS